MKKAQKFILYSDTWERHGRLLRALAHFPNKKERLSFTKLFG
jgi:hypothetical protein